MIDNYDWSFPGDYTDAYEDDAEFFIEYDTALRFGIETGRADADLDD